MSETIPAKLPRVSVICIAYNHERYIEEALDSVFNQSYPNLEIIIVDNASTDSTAQKIKQWTSKNPSCTVILNPTNIGNCKAFNRALDIATGDYIIDFSCDDVLLPDRISRQVQLFSTLNPLTGLVHSNASEINADGREIRLFKSPETSVPEGDVYAEVVRRFFICPPTMMYRMDAVRSIGGYDERLSYEDFDFIVRLARNFPFYYTDEVLTKKRIHKKSMFESIKYSHEYHYSTYLVCEKILNMNRSKLENGALVDRIRYEMVQCLLSECYDLVKKYRLMLFKMDAVLQKDNIVYWLADKKIPLKWTKLFM